MHEPSNRIFTQTEKQIDFVDYAEETIWNSLQVLAFVDTDAGTGNTYTWNIFVAQFF